MKCLREICSDEFNVARFCPRLNLNTRRKEGREAANIVPPEDPFDLREVGFTKISTLARWLNVHSAYVQVERILLGNHRYIRAEAAQFLVYFVTDIGGDRDGRRRDRNSQCDCDGRHQLAALLQSERF